MGDFASVLGVDKDGLSTGGLDPLTDEQVVQELINLLQGEDENEVITLLTPYIRGAKGPKWAKALIRDARDRIKAKVQRIANVANVMIDDVFKKEEDEGF